MKNILIVGGTSGLGLALAQLLASEDNHIIVTGRKDPKENGLQYLFLDIGSDVAKLAVDLDRLVVVDAGWVDILVYAAGFLEDGTVAELDDSDIWRMNNVKIQAPEMLLQRILRRQSLLKGFIAITSTSQWIPRLREPIYCGANAALAKFAHSLSLDQRVWKTLVVEPSGMDTKMQVGRNIGSKLLDPAWVAKEILGWYKRDFRYEIVRVLRDPPRTEPVKE